jgi:hypothetical protein
MAIATLASYLERSKNPVSVTFNKSGANTFSLLCSYFLQNTFAGNTPSTAIAPDNTTTGAININTDVGQGTFDFRPSGAIINNAQISNYSLGLLDILSIQGGLSAIVTTAQTTNLPTAALTRYTSGAGVLIGIHTYLAIGTTATTLTVSYTNQAGTPGRTSKAIVFGGSSGNNVVNRIFIVPFADGDTGARSVESVTLAGTTGTAGNFGVMLFKPIAIYHSTTGLNAPYGDNNFNNLIGGGCQFEAVQPGACLSLFCLGTATSATITGVLQFMDAR